ncbi:transcriptional regulator family: Fungal Specific TF [Penicillium bovifimosum]|uniref:Transcriptional regulator family: Fungal Specific TF n=1 Tax=Penicillium bovifimosum TaxID=126998 RepID=A0A9W9H4U6_9EURO|nr:transcriptional regulator family: Fungal Specific TF [Penicillium bovifimosum]KAJ5138654.1 transcriptional regulator family: Fungal Specific TF [Penicillium bovifimosum]
MARPGAEGPTDRPDESETVKTPHARSLESRRRSSLVIPGDETHADKQIYSPEDFVEWIKDNAEFTFTLMIHRQEKWEQREQEIKEMEDAHKEEVYNLNERIMRLTQQIPRENEDGDSRMEAEYAQMRDELDQAQKEKESLLAVVKMMGGGAPTVKGNHQSPAQKSSDASSSSTGKRSRNAQDDGPDGQWGFRVARTSTPLGPDAPRVVGALATSPGVKRARLLQESDSRAVATTSSRTLQLPPQTSQLLEIYFAVTHSWFPVIAKHNILRASYLYANAPFSITTTSPGSGDHAALWAILSYTITQSRTNSRAGPAEPIALAKEYYTVSRNLIPTEKARYELGHIQALLLLTLVNMGLEDWTAAWLLSGQAVRMATAMGLGALSDSRRSDELRQGKAVFLGCFVIDSLLSFRLSRSPAMPPSDLATVGLLEEDGLEEWNSWADVLPPTGGPPVLSDGKGVKFKPWRAEMQRKLLLNDDHYPTTAHQLAYVSSRCEGKAYGHISPRMQDNSTTPYQTIKDVFDHLESVFYDPNQKQVARDEYLDLKMDAKQDFIDFLADFTRLAEESEQPMDLRKKDLYRKLPPLLQTQVMIHSGDESVSLEQFIHKCQIASRLIAQQVAARNATRNTNRNNNGGTAGRGEASRSTSTKKEITRLTDAEKATLMKERKCFICREQGHVSYNCPKKTNKNKRTAVASATVTGAKAKTKTKDEIEEAETDADSGNG